MSPSPSPPTSTNTRYRASLVLLFAACTGDPHHVALGVSDTISTTLRATTVAYDVRVAVEGDDDAVETEVAAYLEPGGDSFDAVADISCDAPGGSHVDFDFATDYLPYNRAFYHVLFDDQAAPFENLCTVTFTRTSASDAGDIVIPWHVEAHLRWLRKNKRQGELQVFVDVLQQ